MLCCRSMWWKRQPPRPYVRHLKVYSDECKGCMDWHHHLLFPSSLPQHAELAGIWNLSHAMMMSFSIVCVIFCVTDPWPRMLRERSGVVLSVSRGTVRSAGGDTGDRARGNGVQ